MSDNRPPVAARLLLIFLLGCFAALERNPIVRLEAELGLSPSPLERLFGIRGFFSGMTEATHRLARLDISGALQANVLVVPVLLATVAAVMLWRAPKLDTRRREFVFFGLVVAGTAINNIAPSLLEA